MKLYAVKAGWDKFIWLDKLKERVEKEGIDNIHSILGDPLTLGIFDDKSKAYAYIEKRGDIWHAWDLDYIWITEHTLNEGDDEL